MFPFGIVRVWVLGIGGLLQIVGGIDYLRAWFATEPAKHRFLVQGTAMLIGSFTIPLLALLLSRSKSPHRRKFVDTTTSTIDRPDGSRIVAEACGPLNAPTIVLTHGWGLDSSIWPDEFVDQLAARWRVVRWDLPGLGRSSRGNCDFSFETLARDLDAVLSSTNNQHQVLLVGHSLGGMMLQTYAGLFPNLVGRRVAGMVMIDATYIDPTHTARNATTLARLERPVFRPLLRLACVASPVVKFLSWLTYLNGSIHLFTRITMFGRSPPWQELDHVARLLVHTPPAVGVPGLLAMFEHDEQATLATIEVPVLLIAGERDRWTPPECQQFMASQLPHATVDIVDGVGHLPFLEKPQQVAADIDAFFADCLGSKSLHAHDVSAPHTKMTEHLERR